MRVSISPRAERDLETIGDYIAEDNPARAVTFIAELRDHCAAIGKAPEAFRLRPELGGRAVVRARQLRHLLCGGESSVDDHPSFSWRDGRTVAFPRRKE
jgi:plasmid stabilization system protein ParE